MSKLTFETIVEIVEMVAAGRSFRQIGKMQDMPSRSTLQRAYDADPEFKALVDNARNSRMPRVSEGPTLERQRQGGVVWEAIDRSLSDTVIQTRARVKVSTRLDWYKERGTITEAMHRAGETMSSIMFFAGKSPRLCVMFRERVSGLNNQGDRILEKTGAQISLDAALAVLDANERDAIWDVCALDNFAVKTGPLRTGLRALAVHFQTRIS